MELDRRRFLSTCVAGAAASVVGCHDARAAVADVLRAEIASGRECGRRLAALKGTVERLGRATPPVTGRAIVVDIPSQHLAAYQGGRVVFESRVVVGDPVGWRTPDLETQVAYVRFNPTWTVPESILSSRDWRGRLARDPRWFERQNFAVELGGRLVEPRVAAPDASSVSRFVQRPGKGNALGRVKLALAAGNGIYLHDTSDPSAFDEDSRTLSHGCIRLERPMEAAAFALGIPLAQARSLLTADDRSDRKVPEPVRVATTYFTAWPDDAGRVRYYPDVYGRDRASGPCRNYDPDEDVGPPPSGRYPSRSSLED